MQVDAHVHGRPRVGEACSGDAGAVRTIDGVTWVLLVDGLGHGPEAAKVATRAVEEHCSFTAELSLDAAFRRLHARLQGTRGCAAALLRFAERTLGFGGIGNISLRTLEGPSVPYVATNGILGGTRNVRPPQLRSDELVVSGSGCLLLFTDGIVRTMPLREFASLDGEALCRTLVADHSLARDDATVVHVRYQL